MIRLNLSSMSNSDSFDTAQHYHVIIIK